MLAVVARADVFYRVTLVCNPDGSCPAATPAGITERGEIAGSYVTGPYGTAAFFWQQGSGTIIIPGLDCSPTIDPTAMNDLGHVVGASSIYHPYPTLCTGVPVIWMPQGGTSNIGFIANPWNNPGGYAEGVNNLDQVIGYSTSPAGQQHAFLWGADVGMRDLGDLMGGQGASYAWDINDNGWVVGDTDTPEGTEAYLWTPESGMVGLGDLIGYPGFVGSSAGGINNLGQVVGLSASYNGGTHGSGEAFIWDAEHGMRGLGLLFDFGSGADCINDQGEVVGRSPKWDPHYQLPYRFVWDEKRGMRLLDDLIDPCFRATLPNPYPHPLVLTYPGTALNNHGQIAARIAIGVPPAVILTPYVPGDLNGDNRVDIADLAWMLANFGQAAGNYGDGDLNCDQKVDLGDLGWLLSNFGETYP